MKEQSGTPFFDDDVGKNGDEYRLRLYVTGATPNSARAIVNLKAFCEMHLKDKYDLEIIDVYQQPLIAEADQVTAIPMLVKLAPMPQRRLIGDMSDCEKIAR